MVSSKKPEQHPSRNFVGHPGCWAAKQPTKMPIPCDSDKSAKNNTRDALEKVKKLWLAQKDPLRIYIPWSCCIWCRAICHSEKPSLEFGKLLHPNSLHCHQVHISLVAEIPKAFVAPSFLQNCFVGIWNPPALPACLVEWGLTTDCLSVLCFCLYSLS